METGKCKICIFEKFSPGKFEKQVNDSLLSFYIIRQFAVIIE